ncbi:MAG: hypothetical protein M3165_07920, partial [Actinomycetota bacterium]|nr:hypothetical protein [Actinomycetota bacterium]
MACTFQVDFYNYGYGDYWADVDFALQSPTRTDRTISVSSGDSRVRIGDDRPGGGTDLDGEETYTLGFTGTPHPKQGYHVKLTIDAPFSQGARVKHKVFWVRPCPPTAPGGDVPGGGEVPGGEVPGGGVPGGQVPGVPGRGEAGGEVTAPVVSPTTRTRSAPKRIAMAEQIGVFGAAGPARPAGAAA